MHTMGVQVAIIQDGKIVLTKREDFEVWTLPGGEIENGETPAQAAVREAYEETGLRVKLTHLVGLYSKPLWSNTLAVFGAEIIDGEFRLQEGETIDIGYYDRENLPEDTIWWVIPHIEDALASMDGSTVTRIDANLPPAPNRQTLYNHRDESGLSRTEYFKQHFPTGKITNELG